MCYYDDNILAVPVVRYLLPNPHPTPYSPCTDKQLRPVEVSRYNYTSASITALGSRTLDDILPLYTRACMYTQRQRVYYVPDRVRDTHFVPTSCTETFSASQRLSIIHMHTARSARFSIEIPCFRHTYTSARTLQYYI